MIEYGTELHMKTDEITTHPQTDIDSYGLRVFKVTGPVFDEDGETVGWVSLDFHVDKAVKLTGPIMRRYALRLVNSTGTVPKGA